jgi:phosphohistidine phosphatase
MDRTLLLLRHAKSDWPDGVADVDRPLTERGRRDAVAVGRQLTEWDLQLDLVLCSSAVRTRQTWEQAVAGGAQSREVRHVPAIYRADTPELIALVRGLATTVRAVLVLGHGPALPELADLLAGPAATWSDYPTAGLTRLAVDGPWSSLGPDHCRLEAFLTPRG